MPTPSSEDRRTPAPKANPIGLTGRKACVPPENSPTNAIPPTATRPAVLAARGRRQEGT